MRPLARRVRLEAQDTSLSRMRSGVRIPYALPTAVLSAEYRVLSSQAKAKTLDQAGEGLCFSFVFIRAYSCSFVDESRDGGHIPFHQQSLRPPEGDVAREVRRLVG